MLSVEDDAVVDAVAVEVPLPLVFEAGGLSDADSDADAFRVLASFLPRGLCFAGARVGALAAFGIVTMGSRRVGELSDAQCSLVHYHHRVGQLWCLSAD